jgi:hypothetical protein
MKTYVGGWKYTPSSTILDLDTRRRRVAYGTGRLNLGDRAQVIHLIAGEMDLRDSLGAVQRIKIAPTPLGIGFRSPLLYRLSCAGSKK